jgi:hypothetical protein
MANQNAGHHDGPLDKNGKELHEGCHVDVCGKVVSISGDHITIKTDDGLDVFTVPACCVSHHGDPHE